MDDLPDVTGFPLDEAMKRCRELGYEVDIMIARAVKVLPGGGPRVVRFSRTSRDRGVLTVVYEVKGRGGGENGI